MQYSFDLAAPLNSKTAQPLVLPLEDADVRYYPHWLKIQQANCYFAALQGELNWRQDSIKLFGKRVQIPRLQAWYGEEHCQYGYSGLNLPLNPFSPTLFTIKQKVEKDICVPLNCVLCNWYRDGQDSMSMHADNESELGIRPTIASVTLGATRNFDFKHKITGEKYRVALEHGSLLVMAGDTQQNYLHGISKSKRVTHSRINLTYRYIATNYDHNYYER